MTQDVVLATTMQGVVPFRRGKVRDVYDFGEHLLIVATDRVSAFDVVLSQGVPGKGNALTQLSLFWFDQLKDVVANHLVSAAVDEFPLPCRPYRDLLEGRSMLVKKAQPFPAECIVRGYLAGSGWKEYLKSGTVCEIPLPEGLVESNELPEPLFTPSTKAPEGQHDENISFAQLEGLVASPWAHRLRDVSLELYGAAGNVARPKGILLADTKLEFGLRNGELLLIDEVFTPDSSRFWLADLYEPGRSQDSYDKQVIRDYLLSTGWDRNPPAPGLPGEIIARTAQRYQDICDRIAGVPAPA